MSAEGLPFKGEDVRRATASALHALGRARAEIDALNVYPVADADTGTNLYLTVESVAAALPELGRARGRPGRRRPGRAGRRSRELRRDPVPAAARCRGRHDSSCDARGAPTACAAAVPRKPPGLRSPHPWRGRSCRWPRPQLPLLWRAPSRTWSSILEAARRAAHDRSGADARTRWSCSARRGRGLRRAQASSSCSTACTRPSRA